MLTSALVIGLLVLPAQSTPRQATPFESDHEFDEGSHLHVEDLTADQVQGLVLLGKVWGFLKYHHPSIAAGERHWDYDLLRILPRVLDMGDVDGTAAALVELIDTLPPVGGTPSAPESTDAALNADIGWIRDQGVLGDDLSERLVSIYEHRHASGKQFYVDLHPNIGNPQFQHELPYKEIDFPDAGLRILALFRYWNIIQYWFPYRDQIGEDWQTVLAEFVPRLIDARDKHHYRLEMMALIARVNDTHANLWSSLEVQPPIGTRRFPVEVRFIEGQPVVVGHTTPDGASCGLEIGDMLLALDRVPIDSLVEKWRSYYAASNEPTRLRDIARNLTRGKEQSCEVRVKRGDEDLQLVVARRPIAPGTAGAGQAHDLPGEAFRLLTPGIAYLKLSSVKSGETADYIRAASETRGLIIDVRNYPSEFVVFTLGGHLVSELTEFARFTSGDLGNPGAFRWTDAVALTPREPRYQGKVAILVDEVSQSQAEYTTMALRVAPGAVVIGSTTAGADGNVSSIELPGGLHTMISGIGVFYPDKRPTQRVGIVADIEVVPTISGVRDGRDEELEAALRHLLGDDIDEAEIRRLARR